MLEKNKFKNKKINISDYRLNVYITDKYYDEQIKYINYNIPYQSKSFSYILDKNIYLVINDNIYNKYEEKVKNSDTIYLNTFTNEKRLYTQINNKDCYYREKEHSITIVDNNIIIMLLKEKDNYYQFMRLLREIVYRSNENCGKIFLHAAACIYKDKGIMIIGQKKAGKTTLLSYFLGNKSDILANDRVFVDKNLIMYNFPIPIKVGIETFNHNKPYTKYYTNRNFLRPQNITTEEGKYVITNEEILEIFGVNFIEKYNINYVIIPNIIINSNELRLEKLDSLSKEQIFKSICFTPYDESRKEAWVIKRKLSIDQYIDNSKKIGKLLTKNVEFLKCTFGTNIPKEKIMIELGKFFS